MRKNLNSMLLAVLLTALALPGCSKQEQAPQAPPPKPAQTPKPGGAAGAAVQKPMSSASLAPTHLDFSKRTDPFKPFVMAAPPQQAKQEQPATRTSEDQLPIQSFEVTKFKVAGIIAGLRENRALIIDPNGKSYVVQTGMPIGNANGRISRITPATVEVVEKFTAEKGKIRSRTIVLTLAKKR